MNDSILNRLIEILKESSDEEQDWDQITDETPIDSLGIDSLSILDLLYDIDQEFDIQLDASEVIDIETIGQISALLKERGA